MPNRNYTIVKRYMDDGVWKNERRDLPDVPYEFAGREASRVAQELDTKYGDGHFWTVDLENPEGSSYFQLFHGRLS